MGGSEAIYKVGPIPRELPGYLQKFPTLNYLPRGGRLEDSWRYLTYIKDPIKRYIYFHSDFDLRERKKKLCKHYLPLSYPHEIFKYRLHTLL